MASTPAKRFPSTRHRLSPALEKDCTKTPLLPHPEMVHTLRLTVDPPLASTPAEVPQKCIV